jgi:hypothetical protein
VRADVIDYPTPPPPKEGEPVSTFPLPRVPMPVTLADNGTVAANGSLVEVQQFSSPTPGVRLTLTVTWRDGETSHTRDLRAEARRPEGCVVPPTTAPPTPAPPDATTDSEPTDSEPTVSAPAPAAGAGGGGLPVTGAAAGAVAGAAALLLATGTVLLVLTRRRKARFTA